MRYLHSGARVTARRIGSQNASWTVARARRMIVPFITLVALSLTACEVDKLFTSNGLDGTNNSNSPPDDDDNPVPTRLAVLVQPADAVAGNEITPPVQVAAVDNSGSTVAAYTGTVVIDVVNHPSGGNLGGTLARNAVAGVATFPGISVDKAGNGYRLRAVAGGLTAVTTSTFNVAEPPPPPPSRIVRVSGNGQSDTVTAALTQPYVVRVTDASGDPVAGVTVTWSVTGDSDGNVQPAESQTNAAGSASAAHTLGTKPGSHAVTATVAGLQGSPILFVATATHGNATQLVFTQQPSDAEEDDQISPPVVVEVHDRLGNLASSGTHRVSLSIVLLTGHPLARLRGDTTRDTSGGRAVFNNLRIDREASNYRLRAASGGMTGISASFDITGDER